MEIEISIANRNVDLVAEGYDLAIRLGQLPDSSLVAHQLEDASLCLVAAPKYFQNRGAPNDIGDLTSHLCIVFAMPSTGRLAPWIFRHEGQDLEWTPPARVVVADDVLGVVSLAEQGLGICQTYDFIVEESLRQGRLIEVLHHTRGRSRPFSLIFPPHRSLSAATRALIDFLVNEK